jgi:hypothetical protein
VNVTGSVDSTRLNQQLRKLSKVLGVEGGKLIGGYGRLVAQDAMKFTHPRSAAIGAKAVRRDFTRSVGLLEAKKFTSQTRLAESLRVAIKRKWYHRAQELLRIIRKDSGVRVVPFNKTLHSKVRDNRGRVTRSRRVYTLDAGPWKSRLKELLSRVGFFKSGWAIAVQSLGGKVPKWIARHSPYSRGYVDRSRLKSKNPSLVFGSEFPKNQNVRAGLKLSINRRSKQLAGTIRGLLKGHAFDFKNGVVRIHKPKVPKT